MILLTPPYCLQEALPRNLQERGLAITGERCDKFVRGLINNCME
jgi:hypothetical protein